MPPFKIMSKNFFKKSLLVFFLFLVDVLGAGGRASDIVRVRTIRLFRRESSRCRGLYLYQVLSY